MKQTLTLLALCASPALFAQGTCATAVAVDMGDHVVLDADFGDPALPLCVTQNPAQNAAWFRFTAPEDMTIELSTSLPENNGTDTRVHVYQGTCGALLCVGYDDDGGAGFTSLLTLNVLQGVAYTIAFDNYWSSNGFTFRISESVPPPPPPPATITFTPTPLTSGNVLALVDMNNDQLDDVVQVAGSSVLVQNQQVDGSFVGQTIPSPSPTHSPSWSLCAGDLDGNGWNDLMYGGGSGVSFMFRTDDGLAFTQEATSMYIFSQRTNMVDIDNDGLLDAFVCHDVDANVRFMNNGAGPLQMIQGGLGPTCGNYGSMWTDVDNDGLMDLFIAKCGCDPTDILMINQGNELFVSTAAENGMVDGHQSWSAAWGDFDNDGDMDVLIGSSSSSYHKLMRNDGSGNFTNITAGSGFDTFTGTSIEWTTHDFDNDGNLDIMGGNRIMRGDGEMNFVQLTSGVSNGPVGDLNNDGFLDYMNNGVAQMNNGNENHWLKVHTIGTLSNTNGIGARVVVSGPFGIRIREVRSGDGFRYMSSLTTHFGLGQNTQIDAVTIYWPSGIVQEIKNPDVDQTLVVTEQFSTGVAEVVSEPGIRLFPNPAGPWLFWSTSMDLVGKEFRVLDVAGKEVLAGTLRQGPIDVGSLATGQYVLSVPQAGDAAQQRFVKQ